MLGGERGRGRTEFELHGAADVVDGVGDEFVVEDVVVCCVPDAAADDADCQCEGCDGGDEILLRGEGVSVWDSGRVWM